MVCDVAVCHLQPRERTHSQHTCDLCFNRSLIILAGASCMPGTGPEQDASLFESLDNNRLFLSVVISGCYFFHKTLSEPICSSSPLFPPTFWNYPRIIHISPFHLHWKVYREASVFSRPIASLNNRSCTVY